MNVLLTSSGRRVELLKLFQKDISKFNEGYVYTADADPTAPTMHLSEKSFLVPSLSSPNYISELLHIAKKNDIKVIVPLIDPELILLSQHREIFESNDISLMLSNPESIKIADDKMSTFEFFKDLNVSTPSTWKISDYDLIKNKLDFPLIVKPRNGSSSKDTHICKTHEEIQFLSQQSTDFILQEYVSGDEVTIDIFGDGDGNVLSFVPRKRLKIRCGEVERGITIDDKIFRDDIKKICMEYKPFGAINIQCILSENGPSFIEINSRFGGGYPLSYNAGIHFPELLLMLLNGKKPSDQIGNYKKNLIMSRFDNSVFFDSSKIIDQNNLNSEKSF